MWFFPFFLLPCLPQGWHKSPCGQTTKKPRFTKCGFFVFSSFLASHRGDIRARLGIIFVLSCVGSTLLAKSLMTSAILGPHVLLQDLTQAKQIEVQCIRAGIVWMSWWVQGRKQIDTVPTRARNHPYSNQRQISFFSCMLWVGPAHMLHLEAPTYQILSVGYLDRNSKRSSWTTFCHARQFVWDPWAWSNLMNWQV